MRVVLALLALIGLLLSPVAASAAAPACLHHHDGASMAMDMLMPIAAPHAQTGKADPCCDDDGKPAHHDSKSCAQACATSCGVTVALPEAGFGAPLAAGGPVLEPAPNKAFQAHAPPGLKRPPRIIA